jgi:ATP-binding cassette, subfamily C (CFTR/MRP), member 1
LTDSFVYFRLTDAAEQAAAAAQGLSKPQGVGYGIGLGFAIFIMQGE